MAADCGAVLLLLAAAANVWSPALADDESHIDISPVTYQGLELKELRNMRLSTKRTSPPPPPSPIPSCLVLIFVPNKVESWDFFQ